ncbi:MAG: hypothetical protein U5N56_09830 [Candidatus Marinimicrobia bacterium]|nr:hypothetical protein [Candidatus Neomarinimicrobiota bacterium]
MKKSTKFILFLFAGMMMISLISCVEYREEITLNDDASGTLTFEIGLPEYTSIDEEEITELTIISQCDSVEGISVTSRGTYMVDDITWIYVNAEFENITLLNDVRNEWFGRINLEEDEDGNIVYDRVITMSDMETDIRQSKFGYMLKYAFLGQYYWNYTIHFPSELLDSNAPLMRTDTISNTVVWEYNLASLINEEKLMSARYRPAKGIRGFLKNIFNR